MQVLCDTANAVRPGSIYIRPAELPIDEGDLEQLFLELADKVADNTAEHSRLQHQPDNAATAGSGDSDIAQLQAGPVGQAFSEDSLQHPTKQIAQETKRPAAQCKNTTLSDAEQGSVSGSSSTHLQLGATQTDTNDGQSIVHDGQVGKVEEELETAKSQQGQCSRQLTSEIRDTPEYGRHVDTYRPHIKDNDEQLSANDRQLQAAGNASQLAVSGQSHSEAQTQPLASQNAVEQAETSTSSHSASTESVANVQDRPGTSAAEGHHVGQRQDGWKQEQEFKGLAPAGAVPHQCADGQDLPTSSSTTMVSIAMSNSVLLKAVSD